MGSLKCFSFLYDKTIQWSSHRHAPYYLAGVSFAESSFFPIPPDVMLVSMGLAFPRRSWQYAFIATLFSVMGGILGYLIGLYAMEFVEPYILASSYALKYRQIEHWFALHGVWMVILAGFTPFPYKLFTITAGAMQMAFFPFIVGSIIGRGMRFFLVSTLLYFAGERLQIRLRQSIDFLGWLMLLIVVIVYLYIKWMA